MNLTMLLMFALEGFNANSPIKYSLTNENGAWWIWQGTKQEGWSLKDIIEITTGKGQIIIRLSAPRRTLIITNGGVEWCDN